MEVLDVKIWRNECNIIESAMPRFINKMKEDRITQDTPPALIEALHIIGNTLVEFNLLSDIDIDDDNILRRNQAIVITDPYMTYESLSPITRIKANDINGLKSEDFGEVFGL